jgi:hypothetical protein
MLDSGSIVSKAYLLICDVHELEHQEHIKDLKRRLEMPGTPPQRLEEQLETLVLESAMRTGTCRQLAFSVLNELQRPSSTSSIALRKSCVRVIEALTG